MSNELENLIIVIDTREQNQMRIKAVEDWFTGHGAMVEHSALKHCDYRLIGEFRGVNVNLGVEAKGWDNFLSDDITEMEEKLLLATGEYDRVGFFVVSQNYSFKPDENNKHGKLEYSLPSLNNKNLPSKTLAAFEGFLDTISKHPQIHVRQLRGEGQFPYSLYDLLVYLQKPHKLRLSDTEWIQREVNRRMEFKGFGVKKATESLKRHPNLFWLCSSSEESLRQIYGRVLGQTLYDELHNREFETDEWRAGHHRDGTPKDEPVCDFADPKKHAECKTPDHFKQHSKIPSHAEGTILSNHNHPLPSADTIPSHPDRTHSQKDSIPQQRSGDIPQPPTTTETTAVKQEGLSVSFFPPAESHDDIGLDDKPLECVIKCRACHQVIIPEQDDESGFCHDQKCIEERAKPKQKMNLDKTLKDLMQDMKQYTMQDIVKHCEEWGAPYIFDRVMANVKSGNIKKMTEQNGRVTFQRIIC